MLWAPLRKPHENAIDPHWLKRGSVTDVEHPGARPRRSAMQPASGSSTATVVGRPPRAAAQRGRRDRDDAGKPRASPVIAAAARVDRERATFAARQAVSAAMASASSTSRGSSPRPAARGSSSAFGAESIKVELKSHPDTRLAAMAPVGGREAREKATAPLHGVTDPDMGGQFNNKNPGKRGISLNVRHPKGLEIAQAAGGDVRHRRGRLLAGRARQLGPGLRRCCRASSPTSSTCSSRAWARQGTYGRFRTVGPDRERVRRAVGDVGTARAGDAGGLGLLVSRLDGRLQFFARHAERAVPSRAHRRRPVDRCVADRGRALHQRHGDPRLVGQRAHLDALRQPLAATSRRRRTAPIHARARIAGSRSRASPSASGARSPKSPGIRNGRRTRASRLSPARLAHQDALDALVGDWTKSQRRLPADDRAAAGRRAGRRVPDARATAATTIRNWRRSNG